MEIRRSALLAHPVTTVFELVEHAEHYPQFLPWCANAKILMRDESVVVARITMNYHGVRFDITTRNPKRYPHWMAVHLEDGPFRSFEGEWLLTELGAAACKAELSLRYEFGGTLLSRAAGRVFDGVANTLVDAFARRADQLSAAVPAPTDAATAAERGD